MKPTDGLTDGDARTLVYLLGKLKRPYREDVFQAVCGAFVTCPVECVALTRDGKVLMTRRPESDRVFGGLWHTPGTLLLKGDTQASALERLEHKDELRNLPHTPPQWVFSQEVMMGTGPDQCPRQQENSQVYITWVDERDYNGPGAFFPIWDLPQDMVEHHRTHHLKRIRQMFWPE
jgi:hypothetical protein